MRDNICTLPLWMPEKTCSKADIIILFTLLVFNKSVILEIVLMAPRTTHCLIFNVLHCKAGVTTNSATATNCVSLYDLRGIH